MLVIRLLTKSLTLGEMLHTTLPGLLLEEDETGRRLTMHWYANQTAHNSAQYALNLSQRSLSCSALPFPVAQRVTETSYTRLCSTKKILTVNGKFPGPEIHAHKGDTVFVNVYNKGDYNITLHWHGVKQPRNPWSDGPSYITQCPIKPGANFSYEIILSSEEGTIWWHAHSDWSRATVHGAIFVYPKPGTTYPFPKPDAEVPIVLASWFKGDVMEIIEEALATGGTPNVSDASTINGQPGDFHPCSKQGTFRALVEQGKTYLLRMVSAAMNEELFFAVAQHQLTIVGRDGSYIKPLKTDYIMITPGQTMDILLKANQPPSHYYMVARAYVSSTTVGSDETTTTAVLQYSGNYTAPSSPSFPYIPYYNDTQAVTNFTSGLRSLADKDHPIYVPKTIDTQLYITISVNTYPCENNCSGPNGLGLRASMNNISFNLPQIDILRAYYKQISGVFDTDFPKEPPYYFNFTADDLPLNLSTSDKGTKATVVEFNSTVEIVFQGTNLVAGLNHPLHLHGYSFYVVGAGFGNFNNVTDPKGYNLVDPPEVNTVGVPKNGWAAVRFRAKNPGKLATIFCRRWGVVHALSFGTTYKLGYGNCAYSEEWHHPKIKCPTETSVYASMLESAWLLQVKSSPHTRLCSTKKILTVNGQFPGPTLHVHRGDKMIIKVHNEAKYNMTLHWHGVRQARNPWSDGPEYVNQCPIRPGEKYTYRMKLSREEGTIWWHAHSGWARATVHGAIIVYPKPGSHYPFPKPHAEVPIILGEWWKKDVMKIPGEANITGGEPILSDAYTMNGQPGYLYPCSKQGTFKMKVEHGRRYLLRIINAVMDEDLFFSIAQHKMTLVGTDGSYTKPLTTDYIMITPGQTMDVLLEANQPPSLYFMAARSYSSAFGAGYDNTTTSAILRYRASYDPPPSPLFPSLPPYNKTQASTSFTNGLRSLGSKEHPAKVPLHIDTHLFFTISVNLLNCTDKSCKGPFGKRFSASMNNISFVTPSIDVLRAYYYGINGVFNRDFPSKPPKSFDYTADNLPENLLTPAFGTKVKVLEYNSRVELILQGTNVLASDNHPIHLHGYSFYVVGFGFGNFDPKKDPLRYNLVDPPEESTVGVPKNGWVAIRFRADNPGEFNSKFGHFLFILWAGFPCFEDSMCVVNALPFREASKLGNEHGVLSEKWR
ncbi:hypothetical protein HHK36_004107 [Tetracentron sinense]|uniref:Laccase n=1 Tax=Tetracentron sinense TaxID=13715 RepID=A0A835DP68_TETSI|nr:hypothetical protein HHK36_004107 [Tetracentron sinense]